MITLSRSGDTIVFEFQNNPLYLHNGAISAPVNSLSLLIDESDIATFKKAASLDIFLSTSLDELNMTKEELEDWFAENATDAGGMSPEEVEEIVEEATENLFGYAEYDSQSTRINFKHDASGSVISYIDASDFVIDGMIDNVEIVTVQGVKYLKITFNTESGKEPILIPLSDIFDPNEYYTKTEVDNAISAATSGKVDVDVFEEKERVIAASLTDLDDRKLDASAYTPTDLSNYYTKTETDGEISVAVSGKQDTLISGTNIKTINNESILGSGNIDIQGGGKAIEAGRGISITTGETADTVSFNLPISAGTGGNSLLMNEGRTASGNRSVAGGYGSDSRAEGAFVFGQMCTASNSWATVFGNNNSTIGKYSFCCGNSNQINDYFNSNGAFACGTYNIWHSGQTDADKSLFSVGNGSNGVARHNAFEIRLNGDIYITSGGTDIKLQDNLGGGGGGISSAECQTMIDNSISGKVDTSAITTSITSVSTDAQIPSAKAVYDKLGGLSLVKLTQSQYDALSPNYDNNTLYVIVN